MDTAPKRRIRTEGLVATKMTPDELAPISTIYFPKRLAQHRVLEFPSPDLVVNDGTLTQELENTLEKNLCPQEIPRCRKN